MNKELAYWVATSAIPGVGTATFSYLRKHFKTLKKFWEANDAQINKLKLDTKTKENIFKFRNEVGPRAYLEKVYSQGIKVVSSIDATYPANLRQVLDCPPVLYFKGKLLPQDDLAIAVVGARYATAYGRQVTEKLVSQLVMSRLTIVSGLARGIDSFAHKAALDAGGRTIAVLGCGVDLIYPPENKQLSERIIENGALVSEFPLGFPAVPSNFPARNRIISGLSLGVLVTEAAVDSGSLITAGCAAEQGREVFAVPGPIFGKMSEGANKLLKEGVHPTTEAVDILEILAIDAKKQEVISEKQKVVLKDVDQKKILEILDAQNMQIDAIAVETKLSAGKVSAALSILELRGFCKNYGNGVWGK